MKTSELENKLRKHAEITKNVLQVPFKLNSEIESVGERAVGKPKGNIRRTVVIAAVLVLCMITVVMSPLANSIGGFFSDIVGFDGAITGLRYENATGDIIVTAVKTEAEKGSHIIPLELTFKNPNEGPFAYIQEIAIADYIILDGRTGEVLKMECYPEYSGRGEIKDGKALVNLSIGDLKFKPEVEYTIVIKNMYGLAKAEAPLYITGLWKCSFNK